ncbi:MAG: PEP-utilizing enzyme [archaeon]
MLDRTRELFRWGPIDGKLIYVSYFNTAYAELMPKIYKYGFPESLFYFIRHKMTFVCDYGALREAGRKHFRSWIMNGAEFEKLNRDYDSALNDLREAEMQLKKHLGLMQYPLWQQKYLAFWTIGTVPEIANWGGEAILKKKLQLKLGDGQDFVEAFEILSAPEEPSFYQIEMMELLRARSKSDLAKHAKKYYWLGNSYYEQKILDARYFEKRKAQVRVPSFSLQTVADQKNNIIKKHKLDPDTVKTASRLAYCIAWQDRRKAQIFQSNHVIDLFMHELSRKLNLPFEELQWYTHDELTGLLTGKMADVKRREEFVLVHSKNNRLRIGSGRADEDLVRPFLEKIKTKTKTFKGIVVSRGSGSLKGRVRIIESPSEANSIKKGDILVTSMTSPDYITAMRLASAIVTDEGGMTCHAAIISREMNKPCIVGTRVATSVLKDNDIITVDVITGEIRK